MNGAREEILNRLKNANHPEPEKPDLNAPVYYPVNQPLEQAFKDNLEMVNGSVYLLSSEKAVTEELKKLLEDFSAEKVVCYDESLIQLLKKNAISYSSPASLREKNIKASITTCEFLIAHTGTVMVSSTLAGGRQVFIYPPANIVVARKNQLVDFIDAAFHGIQQKYGKQLPSQISLITGPSRTADIEKTLVLGAHGPRELHVLVY